LSYNYIVDVTRNLNTFWHQNIDRLSADNGKPVEKQGRKAIGPKAKAMVA
jgi:hypothetical protein